MNPNKHIGMTVVYQLLKTISDYSNVTKSLLVWDMVGSPISSETNSNDFAGSYVNFLQATNQSDAMLLAVGVPGANERTGAVRLYHFTTNTAKESVANWQEVDGSESLFVGESKGDEFGTSAALARSSDGIMMAVGATQASMGGNGYVIVFNIKQAL